MPRRTKWECICGSSKKSHWCHDCEEWFCSKDCYNDHSRRVHWRGLET